MPHFAAGALGELAVNNKNQILIAEAGGIPPLEVALVRDGNAAQKEYTRGHIVFL